MNDPPASPLIPHDPIGTLSIVVRQLAPVVGMLAFGWSAGQFLLLAVIGIAFDLSATACVGVAVSAEQANPGGRSLYQRVDGWITLAAIGAGVAGLLAVLFGWIVMLMASEHESRLWNRELLWGLAIMIVAALPHLAAQYRHDLQSGLAEDRRRQRDQPRILTLLTSAALILLLSMHVASWGAIGVVIMVGFITALSLLRDLRPDLLPVIGAPPRQLDPTRRRRRKR